MSALPEAVNAGVVVEKLRHVYRGGTVALDNVSLSMGVGLFGLLGPNGAGKSTLMRILCGLLKPTDGRAAVCGLDVVRERRRVRALIGYLPQEFCAWRLQRVEEALDLLAVLSGMADAARRRARVRQVLESVGLDKVADRKVKALSGGMVRRLGVAQALVHDPPVLIVDEPTVGLDPEERIRFRQLMAELGEERVIVLSTHIVADLGPGCRDLTLIDRGQVVFRGSPADLISAASGRVFEIVLPVGGEERLGASFEIVSRMPEGVGVRVRAVASSSTIPESAMLAAAPTLEEGYLAFMASRGRAAAAAASEEAR